MPNFNPGRNVGKLSIRVVPDTTAFRNDLREKLRTIERTTTASIRVTRAILDREKIRNDIRRQMAEMPALEVDANVKVTIDKARLKKTALRKSIQTEFDKFENIRVNIEAAIKNEEHFQKEVRDMVDRASRNKVTISANAFTAAASAQMKWVSRDRFVNLIVRVSKKSIASALTTLAALSGARLSWKWIDDLIDKMKDLDKNLPAIVGWTTGITSGIASIFAATSGLVGIGQGLVSITPALLVIPGLILNALGSATALIVALRNANKELSPLKGEMSELGDIINGQFWDEARQPILDLVTGLMPQLRNAFRELSQGVGEFTGAMARAFGQELADGRLESIFNGIAEGWRVLGTGADGFAGALVSLSNIAATYTPRLAQWFVRQANTFDKWLKAISEDGRLGDWMEGAIDSMYDLWDVTRGVAGVFSGIWKAADQAGSGGLHGFGQLMLEWRRTVNSSDFQRGLSAVFRGSYEAMDAFGGAVKGIGRLVSDNSRAFETFIGSAGKFLGGLIEGIAGALNTPLVANGLNDLSGGLAGALAGILPHLPRIADTFGNFLGLLGDLAGTLLPTAASVLEALMPSIDAIIEAIRPVLPKLGDALQDIVEKLAPSITDLLSALGPAVIDAIVALADGLVTIAPLLDPLIRGLAAVVQAIADLLGWLTDDITDLAGNKPDGTDMILAGKWKVEGVTVDIDALADVRLLTRSLEMDPKIGDLITRDLFDEKTVGAASKAAQDVADAFLDKYESVLADRGKFGADKLVEAIVDSDLPQRVKDAIGRELNSAGYEYDYFKDAGKISANLFADGLNDGKLSIDESMKQWRETFITEWEKSGDAGAQALWDSFSSADQDSAEMQALLTELRKAGVRIEDVMGELGKDALEAFEDSLNSGGGGHGGAGGGFAFARGVAQGLRDGQSDAESASEGLVAAIMQSFDGAGTMLAPSGNLIAEGLRGGITSGIPSIMTTLTGMSPTLQGALGSAGSWLRPQGLTISQGLAGGVSDGRDAVGAAARGLRSSVFGGLGSISLYGFGRNIGLGLAAGIASSQGNIITSITETVQKTRNAARRAAEIQSPSRLMARDVGKPLGDGVAMGIDKSAAGVRKSMTNAIDLSGLSGKGPSFGTGGEGTPSGVALHIHNPVVRDLMQDAYDAANMAGVLL